MASTWEMVLAEQWPTLSESEKPQMLWQMVEENTEK